MIIGLILTILGILFSYKLVEQKDILEEHMRILYPNENFDMLFGIAQFIGLVLIFAGIYVLVI